MTERSFSAPVAVTTIIFWNLTILVCLVSGSSQVVLAVDSMEALAKSVIHHMWARLLEVGLSVLGVISILEDAMNALQRLLAIPAMETTLYSSAYASTIGFDLYF